MNKTTRSKVSKAKSQRLGIYYRSHGEWTRYPYSGVSYTPYQVTRNPWKKEIAYLKNDVLKSQIRLLPIV